MNSGYSMTTHARGAEKLDWSWGEQIRVDGMRHTRVRLARATDQWIGVGRRMPARVSRVMVIAAVAILYGLIALPLPYLLLDHYSAVHAGDPDHSDADVHAWLEWAASSSLSGTGLILPSVLLPSALLPIPSVQEVLSLLVSVPYSRSPPAAV